ncbi:MAG: GNAT family N-acetyltransferase [Isosphaeraceae bacterium]
MTQVSRPLSPTPSFWARDARLTDLEVVIDFNQNLALETEAKSLDLQILRAGVLAAMEHPGRLRYWVAESQESGKVVGQAAVTSEWSDWRNGWLWWYQSVYVRRESRGQGVFRCLHDHIRSIARRAGDVVGLRLYVEQQNLRAQRTYEKLGLVPGGYQVYQEIWPERFGGTLRPETPSIGEILD